MKPGSVIDFCAVIAGLLSLILVLGSTTVQAQLFQCENEAGNKVFQDRPCSGKAEALAEERISEGALPAVNGSSPTGVSETRRASGGAAPSTTWRYQITDPNGTVRNVSQQEYEAQVSKNREIRQARADREAAGAQEVAEPQTWEERSRIETDRQNRCMVATRQIAKIKSCGRVCLPQLDGALRRQKNNCDD